MFDVLGPSLALNVDERVQLHLLEVDHHKGRLVARLVQEWIIFGFKAAPIGVVLDGPDVLLVGVVLALAGDLNFARREGGALGEFVRLRIVGFRFPAVDLRSFIHSITGLDILLYEAGV